MAMKKYTWRGFTYQIADEDLGLYPGAVPVEEEPKEKAADVKPMNKARKPAKNKKAKEK